MWDNIMSKLSNLCGMVVNLGIMIGVGFSDFSTAPYKAYNIWKVAYAHNDWMKYGQGMQLLMAQLAKYDAPEIETDIISTYMHF